MPENRERVLDEHALDEQHIPAPAGHAPRLEAIYAREGLCVYERERPETYLLAEQPVEVRE